MEECSPSLCTNVRAWKKGKNDLKMHSKSQGHMWLQLHSMRLIRHRLQPLGYVCLLIPLSLFFPSSSLQNSNEYFVSALLNLHFLEFFSLSPVVIVKSGIGLSKNRPQDGMEESKIGSIIRNGERACMF